MIPEIYSYGALDLFHAVSVVTICRLEKFVNECYTESANKKLKVLSEECGKIPLTALEEYMETDVSKMTKKRRRLYKLVNLLPEEYRTLGETLFELIIFEAVFPEAKALMNDLQLSVSIQTAYSMEYGKICPSEISANMYHLLKPLFVRDDASEDLWCGKYEWKADNRILCYLSGDDKLPLEIEDLCSIFSKDSHLPPWYLSNEPMKKIISAFSLKGSVLQIRGNIGSGRKFLIKHSAKKSGSSLLFADFSAIAATTPIKAKRYLELIRRECIWYEYILCWHFVTEESFKGTSWDKHDFMRLCVDFFRKSDIRVCCCIEQGQEFFDYFESPSYRINMPPMEEKDRQILWQSYCSAHSLTEEINSSEFAMRYQLSCGQIASVFQQYENEGTEGDILPVERMKKLCREIAKPNGKLLRSVNAGYQFSDLKLPESEKNTIQKICANFKYHYRVYSEWRMKTKVPYGRAVSVLLMGPPGTGKTMTAHVIANMLELPLFQADLSQIADKYIGETEKHLDVIFSEAEKTNCVLLLDEADAVCGKRSEVHEAKDRYANNDTAFLLQRLESYDGIVILSTNFINNLDHAFLRRMRFIISFNIPEAAVRREIWESCFPSEMPVSDNIDFEYLAEQFDFTGANIKNIVLGAAFLAASEQKPVEMRHILKEIGNEYLKFQKRILSGEFGKYSDEYENSVLL